MSGCTSCGQRPSRRARFCPRCGERLTGPDGLPPVADARAAGDRGRRAARRRAIPGLRPLVAVGALVVLGAVAASGLTAPIDAASRFPGSPPTGDVRLDTTPDPRPPEPVDDGPDVVAAHGIDGGDVLVLGADHRLRRVGLPPEGDTSGDRAPLLRWEQHPTDVPPGAGEPSLGVDGPLALVGDARGVSAVAIADGTLRWRVALPGTPAGPSYRAWRIGDDVMVANRFHLAAVDVDSGELAWSIERPPGDVQPIAGGVAVIAPDAVRAFTAERDQPAWQRRRAAPNRGAFGVVDRSAGPVVIGGPAAVTLDPHDGRILIEHGPASVVTRAGDASVVAAEWDAADGSPTLVGYASDGTARWRTPGPDVRCCELLLRPTQAGQVLAATIGRGRTEVGWLIDPADGRITATVRRPSSTAVLPLAVGDDTAVWVDGDGLVGAALDTGVVRWRAAPGTVLLSETPLLLGTPDGLVRP